MTAPCPSGDTDCTADCGRCKGTHVDLAAARREARCACPQRCCAVPCHGVCGCQCHAEG